MKILKTATLLTLVMSISANKTMPEDIAKHFTVHVNNNFLPHSLNALQHESTQHTNITHRLKHIIAPQQIIKTTDLLREQTKKIAEKSTQFIKTYKYRIAGLTLLGLYGSVLYYLVTGSKYLTNKNHWAYWPDTMPFDELLEMSNKDVIDLLLTEIQLRYVNPENPTNHITPLVQFMREIEKEKRYITFYATLFQWVEKARLSRIFPGNKTPFKKTKEQLERLAYIKHIFLSWAASFNIRGLDQIETTI